MKPLLVKPLKKRFPSCNNSVEFLPAHHVTLNKNIMSALPVQSTIPPTSKTPKTVAE